MKEEIIIAGFGGQGVMSIGQVLAYAGMTEGQNVSWLPSYGPEMRGGTANCNVQISDKMIASPVVTKATTALVLNQPSLDKFENSVQASGRLFINSSLINKKSKRSDLEVYYVPANGIALELGNSKVANMVMLGAYLEVTKAVSIDSVISAFESVFGAKKKKFFPINIKAIELGAESVRDM